MNKPCWRKKKPTLHQIFPFRFPIPLRQPFIPKSKPKKSGFFRFLFGEHYRKYYSLPIVAKTATIDTLFGGLQPKRAGGGHQSKSLQLVAQDGKEYTMRALKKSASRFLQSVAFKDQFIAKEFEDTYAEDFLFDIYTTAHPYMPFTVGNLADKIGVAHTNPLLYYIPKHKALGRFNTDFGDELSNG